MPLGTEVNEEKTLALGDDVGVICDFPTCSLERSLDWVVAVISEGFLGVDGYSLALRWGRPELGVG
jgi:hypothetical protein